MDITTRLDALTEAEAKAALVAFALYVGRNVKCLHNSEDTCQFYDTGKCHKNTPEDCAALWLNDALKEARNEA